MEAFRKVATVENHKLTLNLPDAFNDRQVEVIVLPCAPDAAPADSDSAWQEDFLSVSCWSDLDGAEGVQSWPLQKF